MSHLISHASQPVNCILCILIQYYERAKDDELLLVLTSKLGIISSKQHRGHIGNLQGQIYLLQMQFSVYQAGLSKQQS